MYDKIHYKKKKKRNEDLYAMYTHYFCVIPGSKPFQ